MNRLDLYFSNLPNFQLIKTCFYLNYDAPIVAVRGKNLLYLGQTGSFLWSSGVKSLVYLLVNSIFFYQIDQASMFPGIRFLYEKWSVDIDRRSAQERMKEVKVSLQSRV